MNSRLDAGRFTAADIQTMARAVDVPAEKVRRLTEVAVFIAKLPARPSEPPAVTEALRPQVVAFAHLMERVLRDNDYKGGWQDCKPDWLLMRLRQEVAELDSAMTTGTIPHTGVDDRTSDIPADVAREAADVANFAMMIADVLGVLAATPESGAAGEPGER